jgi:hypothetical protein
MPGGTPAEPSKRLSHRQGRRLRVACVVVLLGAAVVVLAVHLGSGEKPAVPGDDADNVILSELSSVNRAVPAGAHVTRVIRIVPDVTGPCRTLTLNTSAGSGFSSPASMSSVHSQVEAVLRADGWVHGTASGPDRWYDYIGGRQVLADHFTYHWQRKLPQGTTAVATLQVGVPVDGLAAGEPLAWTLEATSSTVGGQVMRCRPS